MSAQTNLEEDLASRIEAALESIRPYLIADGGNIRISEITDNHVVRLEFVGACGSCPMSAMTFKAGVEEAIKKSVPEIKGIEVTNLASLA
jgi:Fe-S cluster biogenesis protein NfuA